MAGGNGGRFIRQKDYDAVRKSLRIQSGKLGEALGRCRQLEAELENAYRRNREMYAAAEGQANGAYWMGMKVGATFVLGLNVVVGLLAVGMGLSGS